MSMGEDNRYANYQANYLVRKHGYWMAMYHCMTLCIWCHKGFPGKITADEDYMFWWKVRNIIWSSK